MNKPNIFDKILKRVGLIRKSQASVPLAENFGSNEYMIWSSEKKMSAKEAMNLNKGWVYACVRAISEAVGSIEFKLYKVKKDDDYEEVYDHELLDILHAVNPFMTGFELKSTTAAHMELAGNAYWLLDGVENEGGQPTAIFPLNPKYVKVVKAELPEFISGYEYTINGKTTVYKTFQILHFKIPDPNDPYEGIGTVQAIKSWVDQDNYATELNRQYFANGARLAGILKTGVLGTEQLEYIKQSFKAIYAGVANAYEVAALPAGVEYQELGNTPKDMDFANLQNSMREKILAGFRVPKTILGSAESETNRATAETSNYVFADRTIKPRMQLIVDYLNEFLVPRFGDDLVLGFTDPVPENREEKMKELTAAIGQQPIISVNEARERYFGLGEIENGDAVMGDYSKIPVGEPIKTMDRNTIKNIRRRGKKGSNVIKVRKEMSESIVKSALESLKGIEIKAVEATKTKDITMLSDDEFEAVYKGFLTRTTPYEKALQNQIKNFNKDQMKEVLKKLPEEVKNFHEAKTKALSDLFNVDKWVSALVDLSLPIMVDLYGKEGAAASQLIGLDPDRDIVTPKVRENIEKTVRKFAESYNLSTQTLLVEKITEGLAEGVSIDQLADKVSDVYEYSDEVRALQVARTETFRIANASTHDQWKESGIVKTIKWYTGADERVCGYCEPMHGKVIDIDEDFFSKGDTVTDSDGHNLTLDYDDVSYPPLHVSCRCYVRPEKISLRSQPEVNVQEEIAKKADEIAKAKIAEVIPTLKQELKQEVKEELKPEIEKEIEERAIEKANQKTDELEESINKALNE